MLIQRVPRADRVAGQPTSRFFVGTVASVILSIAHQATNAMSPAPPWPCPKTLSTEPAEQLANRVANPSSPDRWRECAADALAEKGAVAMPFLMHLIQVGDQRAQFLAMNRVSEAQARGGSAREIVPLIVHRLKTYDLDNSNVRQQVYDVYGVLGLLGKDATPAIPLLIERSRSDKPGLAKPESYWAIQALGNIGKYDTRRVVPHLMQLLDDPSHRVDAANALANLATSARGAVPALTSHLEASLDAISNGFSASLMRALARCADSGTAVPILMPILLAPGFEMQAASALREIGPPAAPAVPYLLNRLENSSSPAEEKITDVLALLVIDPNSVETLRRILAQATRSNSYEIADELAHLKALPTALAPDLRNAIDTAPDARIRQAYIEALEKTHPKSLRAFDVSKTS